MANSNPQNFFDKNPAGSSGSKSPRIKLSFCGGTGSVTGANFLLEVYGAPGAPMGAASSASSVGSAAEKPYRILVDCGLEQGSDFADRSNHEPFPYKPADIAVLLVTHAHADHIGRIPKLVRDGFRGVIYSTPATRDLSEVMLPDALHIVTEEARAKHEAPLYTAEDIQAAFSLWRTINYYVPTDIGSCISVTAKDSGHILGSAMYEVTIGTALCPSVGAFVPVVPAEGDQNSWKKAAKNRAATHTTIVFTGDLGNSPALFLRDTDPITDADYIVMESVYGDRNHESKDERRAKLAAVISDTAARKRTLIIPAFSLERTQDILFEMNELEHAGKIPAIPVYLDSPLATKVTEVYKRYEIDFNENAKALMASSPGEKDLFAVPKLKSTHDNRDSIQLDQLPNPKIILAGSGMSHGGRIVHHEQRFLPDPNATILLVGYQSVGTLGREIQDGAKEVVIAGQKIPIRAEIKGIFGYSSHKDSDHLIDFVSEDASVLKKCFVAMGEPKAALFLAQRLRDYLGVNAIVPKKGDSVEL